MLGVPGTITCSRVTLRLCEEHVSLVCGGGIEDYREVNGRGLSIILVPVFFPFNLLSSHHNASSSALI